MSRVVCSGPLPLAQVWTGRKTVLQVFGVAGPGIEPSLPAIMARAQPTEAIYDKFTLLITRYFLQEIETRSDSSNFAFQKGSRC